MASMSRRKQCSIDSEIIIEPRTYSESRHTLRIASASHDFLRARSTPLNIEKNFWESIVYLKTRWKLQKRIHLVGESFTNKIRYSSNFAHFCNFYIISRYTIDLLKMNELENRLCILNRDENYRSEKIYFRPIKL